MKDIVKLNVKIERDLKQRFLKIAKNNDTDGSKLIRKWIRDYLRKNAQQKIKFEQQ